MIEQIAYLIPMSAGYVPGGAGAAEKLKGLSGAEKLILAFKYGDLMTIITSLVLMCAATIFIMMFVRRWNISRMGYFFVTALTFGVRIQKPDIVFWTPFAFCAGLFSIFMFFLSHKNVDFDSRKEPLYFVFNGFALFLLAFPMGKPMNSYVSAFALTSMILSLFFVVTKKHVPSGKFVKNDADEALMNILEKKAGRPL